MDTFAPLPADEREPYLLEAAARIGLPPHVIEKDFWVCWTLKRLFALESVAGDLMFKGGTSLSKVYQLIRRFSEDIDLSIHRGSLGFGGEDDPANPELSNKARQRLIDALKEACQKRIGEEVLPELNNAMKAQLGEDGWSLGPDPSDPDSQSLAFTYPTTSMTLDPTAYLRPAVKIEFGARSDHWPAEPKTVRSYLAEALPEALEECEVEAKTMSSERTFWEKATILHQEAHRAPEKPMPARYSRHYCDLAAMIGAGTGEGAAARGNLLQSVVAHKQAFYRCGWASYETAKRGTLRLLPPEDRHGDLARDLASMSEMFFDEPPALEDVLQALGAWEATFNQPG